MNVRRIAAVVCAGAVLAGAIGLGGCSINFSSLQQANFHETRETWAPFAVEQAIAIESANGAITIRESADAADDQVKIVADIRALTEERLALTAVHADRQADGSLLIWIEWPEDGRQGSEGAKLEIDLPGPAVQAIAATTSNGAIELTGLSSEEGARLKSSNGAITVRGHAGAIDARTSNGAVTIEGATADVDAHSSNGRIKIVQAPPPGAGSIVAQTSNGAVTIDLASGFAGAISGRTSNGTVSLPGGDDVTVVRSGRRDGEVAIGDAAAARVEVRTSNGTVQVRR